MTKESSPSSPGAAQGVPEPKLLRIGDFARFADTNLRTLRYYEELGLLTPYKRSQGGFRYYRESDVNRLNMIRGLQELGLPLERIRELMATRDEGISRPEFIRRVTEALAEQDRLLVEHMASLEEQRTRIQAARQKLDQCSPCNHTPQWENNFCEPCQNSGQVLPEHLSALF